MAIRLVSSFRVVTRRVYARLKEGPPSVAAATSGGDSPESFSKVRPGEFAS